MSFKRKGLKERVCEAIAGGWGNGGGKHWSWGMESEPPAAACLDRKYNVSLFLEFVSIIHQVRGRGKKDVSCLKEFTLDADRRVGESEAGPALG